MTPAGASADVTRQGPPHQQAVRSAHVAAPLTHLMHVRQMLMQQSRSASSSIYLTGLSLLLKVEYRENVRILLQSFTIA